LTLLRNVALGAADEGEWRTGRREDGKTERFEDWISRDADAEERRR
jgi:hypothetical protein